MGSYLSKELLSKLFDFAGLAALIGIPYLVGSRRKSRLQFDFGFDASAGSVEKGKYIFVITGDVKNPSIAPNSIVQIRLIVWKNKKRNSYLRFGNRPKIDNIFTSEEIFLPIYFKEREAKKLRIKYVIPIKGTSDEKILSEKIERIKGSGILFLKHRYEICIEDIFGNHFDQSGKIVNMEEADLWWTLENTFRDLKDWNINPFVIKSLNIFLSKLRFFFKKLLWNLGL